MTSSPSRAPIRQPDEILLAFTRALRAAGVPVTHDRAHGFLVAAALLGGDDRRGTYLAGRATLCAGPDDLSRYDLVFAAFFGGGDGLPRSPATRRRRAAARAGLPAAEGVGGDELDDDPVPASASDVEILRHRDVATVSVAEMRRLASMFASLRLCPPTRRSARHRRRRRGEVDAMRTMRASLRRMGEPAEIARRRRAERPRRVVLLVDVSGSMSGYADALLRLAHSFTHGQGAVETFTIGTRLTHLTRAMRIRDVERALIAAGETVPDWSGGTRLGETLRIFLDRWGQRGLARGAVVVILSDGWERGDPTLLGEQMARLHRVAHRVIWASPHRGKSGYEPVQRGVVAVLPHCDHFVAGHSLAAFAELATVIAHS
jgi:uncharacterized protein with von Willebrand factor type A (vWA) domain